MSVQKKNSVLFPFPCTIVAILEEPRVPISPVSGISGAARVQRLDLDGIRKAERHGKRLDWSSMQRRVRSADPLVWPEDRGLDLMELYEEHVKDVFVPSGDTKMLHTIVQFPKELISENEPELMLAGARKFAERVFGAESVVAARIDQDEKGRHVVDVFVVPIYEKKTKHTTKRAVSISKHMKELAEKQGLVEDYNKDAEEKNKVIAASRAELRSSLIRKRLPSPASLRSNTDGVPNRSDLARLFTRPPGARSSGMAAAVASLRRLSRRELDQDELDREIGHDRVVFSPRRSGIQRQLLGRGLRHPDGPVEGEQRSHSADHTPTARTTSATRRKPVGPAGRAGSRGPKQITSPNLFMQGVALQNELHVFLRDEMGLANVQRGHQKRAPGFDWLSSEQLDIQRKREAALDLAFEAEAAMKVAAQIEAGANKIFDRATRDQSEAIADRTAAAKARADAETERAAAAEARRLIETEKAAVRAAQLQATQQAAAAAQEREKARLEAQEAAAQKRASEAALADAQATRYAALAEQAKAAEARKAAEAEQQDARKRKQEAEAALAAAAADRRAAEENRKFAMVERAKAAEALQAAAVETQKAQTVRAEAERKRKESDGVLVALTLWQRREIEPTGTPEQPSWRWLSSEVRAKWTDQVMAGGRKAWEVVSAAAARLREAVEKAIQQALRPEQLDAAARERVSNVDLMRVVTADTEEIARKELRKIVERAPVQKPLEQLDELSPALREYLRKREQGMGPR